MVHTIAGLTAVRPVLAKPVMTDATAPPAECVQVQVDHPKARRADAWRLPSFEKTGLALRIDMRTGSDIAYRHRNDKGNM